MYVAHGPMVRPENMSVRRAAGALPIFAILAFINGCATVSAVDSQARTREMIAERVTLPAGAATAGEPAALEALTTELTRAPLSPDAAVALAYLRSPRLRERLAGLDIAAADLEQARLPANPTLFASARFPNRSGPGSNVEFSLSAQVLDYLLLPARGRLARTEFERIQAGVSRAAVELLQDVRTAWVAAVGALEGSALHDEIAEAADISAELARRFRAAGNISPSHLAIEEAAAAEARAGALRARTEAGDARERLRRLLALPTGTDWSLPRAMPELPGKDPVFEPLLKTADERRLDLAGARANIVALRRALATARHWRWTGGVIAVGVDTEKDPDGLRVTGPTLSIGLPVFDRQQAAIARLTAQLRQAEADAEALGMEIHSDVRSTHARMLAAREQRNLYADRVIPARAAALRELQLEQNYMLIGVFDLLTAKQRESDARLGESAARRDYWLARADLARAIGGGNLSVEESFDE